MGHASVISSDVILYGPEAADEASLDAVDEAAVAAAKDAEVITAAECEDATEHDLLKELATLCGHQLRSTFVNEMLCSKDVGTADDDCINGKCSCGFQTFWSKGYRKYVVDDEGNIKATASPVWRQKIRWQASD